MSITSLNYNAQNNSLEIIVKFFTDDLEKALEETTDKALFLATNKEADETDSLLKVYLLNHMTFTQKNKVLPLVFLGKEADRDYTFTYLEIEKFNPSKTTQITNNLLISTYEDQVNQVNYKNGKHSKSISLHKNLITSSF